MTRASGWAATGLAVAAAAGIALHVHGQAENGLGFTTHVTPGLVRSLAKSNSPAPGLLRRWQEFAAAKKLPPFMPRLEAAAGREAEVLQEVNAFLNRIPYQTDQAHWGQLDYWATPAEAVGSDGGDCEDYAIAKYYLLKELGVPIHRLRITYVKAIKLNEAHMVLGYYPRPGAVPLILDNQEDTVRPATQRTDLVPVYIFNDDEVAVVNSTQRGKPSQLRTWLSLQQRLQAQDRM